MFWLRRFQVGRRGSHGFHDRVLDQKVDVATDFEVREIEDEDGFELAEPRASDAYVEHSGGLGRKYGWCNRKAV